MSYDDEIQNMRRHFDGDEFDLIAAQIEGTGGAETISAAKSLTVRFTLDTYASISTLAEMAGDAPKNAMVNQLVYAAVHQTINRLSPESQEAFVTRQSQILSILCGEAGVDFEQICEQSGAVSNLKGL